ncbi:MAG TPA: pirin family protein [Caulobacteraceae bacterium]|jgi:redox-sensitive bicupin YhaK (pirin superfamily)|nr:pirin family protein [Caulobacteraceae bacterium]
MIELVIDATKKDLGGFEVGRILPFARRRMVGPFVFLDHMGPAAFAPGMGIDVRPHPHIGLSTLTYLFEGEIMHRDNLGVTQAIRPGEVNWMTAGRGIVHSERTDPSIRIHGGPMHGMQAWIALPHEDEEIEPSFSHHEEVELPTYQSGGLWGRLVAGSAYGAKAGVHVHSPLFYVHWEMQPGAKGGPPEGYSESAAYVARGTVEVDGRELHAGQMAVFEKGARPTVTAVTPATVMLLGGEPIGPRIVWWNLVSSNRERIEQAKADWKAGRMALPPGDDTEFIPLPEDPPVPKAEPMS